jgi:hypothetical protein
MTIWTYEIAQAKRLVGSVLLLVLASCTAAPPPVEGPSPATDTTTVERQLLEAPATPVATATPTPIKERDEDPKQLFGLNGQRVAALLGPASFVRRDGPAEVWQYRAKACVLDVYLYKDAKDLTVAHVDLRKRKKATQPPRRCFAALLESQE